MFLAQQIIRLPILKPHTAMQLLAFYTFSILAPEMKSSILLSKIAFLIPYARIWAADHGDGDAEVETLAAYRAHGNSVNPSRFKSASSFKTANSLAFASTSTVSVRFFHAFGKSRGLM